MTSSTAKIPVEKNESKGNKPKFPGIRVTTNGNQLIAYHTEARITDAGIFYPITPSTEGGENYQLSNAEGNLNVFGKSTIAIEAEGEHAAQGGAIAFSLTGKRVVNFTSGQGLTYGSEQYYGAPGKGSTMVVEVGARALTKHALNVHCGHDDIYAILDAGWIMLFGKDAQQTADQALIIRKVCELTLTPGINIQDGFLTSHLERTFYKHESALMREYLGAPEDIIDTPTESQKVLFGPKRRRIPQMIDLKNPLMLGPVQNQEHYMNGVVARRNNFVEGILPFLQQAYQEFYELTGRYYGLISEYKTQHADTIFLSMGSAAENIEAAVDYLEEKGDKVGSIHLNVLRPFPSAALVKAVMGKKNVIVLDRTDEPMSADNPLAKELRAVLTKALENKKCPPSVGAENDIPGLSENEIPRIFDGSYGLGSRDFRPEGILGAYEFVKGKTKRQDGKTAKDGVNYFTLGINHPYQVKSKNSPSLLPEKSIAIRFHSIGGWGMITTGKNLGEIIGELGNYVSEKNGEYDRHGHLKEAVHISANPKYGSEKKGAPTEYFLVAAPERIRVNCDLKHVSVVLCCDPKAFTHTNPLEGMADGGALIWESNESPKQAWERIPIKYRSEIIEKKIRLFILPGFNIARAATNREDLQLRMQGNSFLGAFFKVSTFLQDNELDDELFRDIVRKQYQKKFGRFGDAVIESNMTVMSSGFDQVEAVEYGQVDAPDYSSMRGDCIHPVSNESDMYNKVDKPNNQADKYPLQTTKVFNDEFQAGLGYHQPASPLAAMGVAAPSTGAQASKYVARRQIPIYTAENCTQCMECISGCPDTALPNTAQDITTVVTTVFKNYVSNKSDRDQLLKSRVEISNQCRETMNQAITNKETVPFINILEENILSFNGISKESRTEVMAVAKTLPMAYSKVNAIFKSPEKKSPGEGGLFSIFVSDLCKGCGLCVDLCGDHDALTMVDETVEMNALTQTTTNFLDLLPDTSQKFLGNYNDLKPHEAKAGVLRNHLMVRRNYDGLVSGDGACAGCGEKSIMHTLASITESYMRPMYHAKAERLIEKSMQLKDLGPAKLFKMKSDYPEAYELYRKSVLHLILGLGGENEKDTSVRFKEAGKFSDEKLVESLILILEQESFNHRDLQSIEGRLDNGMSVMAMGAHTGCNTVFGSTPPNNPHPYPWMNSLFQDGATITWMFGESFIQDHSRRSVLPERLADLLLNNESRLINEEDYFEYTHFGDHYMTRQEIRELPKAWTIGGDGGMGDIGFQNVSKVVLQNRPNVKMLMLDTQVYSNTGGQNSDSSLMLGGYDMNQFGKATQGKFTEKKSVAECFMGGHGSPFVAQVSMANSANLYRAMLDCLEYRGTAFLQCFTTCQPEHGVADDMSVKQAQRIRDSRGMPEFVFNPELGETYGDSLNIKGNPSPKTDWWQAKFKSTGEKYNYTTAHWCLTEARFRRHHKKITKELASEFISLDEVLLRVTQADVVNRNFFNENHRAFIPDFGVYITSENDKGEITYHTLSRQMVLFCIERRKAWRLIQSKAGLVNKDYLAQKSLLKKVESEKITLDDFLKNGKDLFTEEKEALKAS